MLSKTRNPLAKVLKKKEAKAKKQTNKKKNEKEGNVVVVCGADESAIV